MTEGLFALGALALIIVVFVAILKLGGARRLDSSPSPNESSGGGRLGRLN